MIEAALSALPEAVRKPLRELAGALEAALGSNLVSLVVHGSAVRGDFRPDASDVDVIVVLADTAFEQLAKAADPLLLARHSARVEAMLLRAQELPRTADAFPLFYGDVQRRHVVVSGSDPFAGLTISTAGRRLRIEQELREARIRMRKSALETLGERTELVGPLERKLRQLRSPLHALLELQGAACADGLAEVLNASGRRLGVDVAPLLDVAARPEAAHVAYRQLLEKAIESLDALPPEAAR